MSLILSSSAHFTIQSMSHMGRLRSGCVFVYMFGVHTIMRPAASQDNDLILSLPVPITTYCDIITGRGQSCSQEIFLLSNTVVCYQQILNATKGLSSNQKMPLSMFHLTLPVGW